MIFNGVDKQTVEFKIVDYELPKDKPELIDWLFVSIIVKSKAGDWVSNKVSVGAFEIQGLIDWFNNLTILNKSINDSYPFIEQDLIFLYLGKTKNIKKIRIIIDAQAKPKTAEEGKEYFVDCEWTDAELKILVIDLTEELNKYPDRIPPKQTDVLLQNLHDTILTLTSDIKCAKEIVEEMISKN